LERLLGRSLKRLSLRERYRRIKRLCRERERSRGIKRLLREDNRRNNFKRRRKY
jgi:hypothetical protein